MKLKQRVIIAAILAVIMALSIGAYAFFTDYAADSTSARAGTLEVSVTNLTGDFLTNVDTKTLLLIPGIPQEFSFTVNNIGEKSADVMPVVTLKLDKALTPTNYEIYIADAEGNAIPAELSEDCMTAKFKVDSVTLNGTIEEEPGITETSHTFTLKLILRADADTDWQGVKLESDLEVFTKQHRNTSDETDWAGKVEKGDSETEEPGEGSGGSGGSAEPELKTYSITYVLRGGSMVTGYPSSYKEGQSVTLPEAARTGFDFMGWYLDSACSGSAVSSTSGLAGNKIFYALWDAIEYSISYESNGGAMPDAVVSYYTIDAATTLPVPTKRGYVFGGWYENADLSGNAIYQIAKGNMGAKTLYAKWEIDKNADITNPELTVVAPAITSQTKVTVTGNAKDDSGIKSVTVNGQTVTVNADGSWSAEVDVPSADTTVTVVATDNAGNTTTVTKTVIYDASGPSVDADVVSITNKDKVTVTGTVTDANGVEKVTVNGKVVDVDEDGNFSAEVALTPGNNEIVIEATDKIGNKTTVAENVIYDNTNPELTVTAPATTSQTKVTVTGNAKDDNGIKSVTVNGQTVTVNADGSWSAEVDVPSADTTVTVVATDNAGNTATVTKTVLTTYSIAYNLNSGTLASDAVTSYNVNTATFNLPTPTKSGYAFNGWYTASDFSGSAVTRIEKGSTGNKTFYAKWQKTYYDVIYAANDGSGTTYRPTGLHSYGNSFDVWSNTGDNEFIRTGYTITGWNTKADGTGTSYALGETVANGLWDGNIMSPLVTLYAQWELVPEAFAVYSATDNSLRFYNNGDATPSAGTTYKGRAVTAVYTGFEENVYETVYLDSTVPWYSLRESITSVVFEDEIKPVSTAYWFHAFTNCSSFDVSKLNTSNVTDMTWMFYLCPSLSELDVTGFDTSKVTIITGMFAYCPGLTELDVSNFNTSNVVYMAGTFQGCEGLTEVDLSSWDASSCLSLANLFAECPNLHTIKTPKNISSTILLMSTTSKTYYDITDNNKEYKKGTFPVGNGATSHTLTDTKPVEAFAVYSATDKSLRLYKNGDAVPEKDSTYKGRVVTAVYTGIENDTTYPAWYASVSYKPLITSVVVEDVISPVNTSRWFEGFTACTEMNLAKLDTSNVTNMANMFYQTGQNAAGATVNLDLSGWDTSNVTNMQTLFKLSFQSSTIVNINLSGWDTSKITNMSGMFQGIGNNVTSTLKLDFTGWDTSNVTNMSFMFYCAGQNKPKTFIINGLSGWDTSKVTDMNYMFGCVGQYATNTWSIGDISGWNTAEVTNMTSMFLAAGQNATNFTLDLSKWNVSKVTSYGNFNYNVSSKIIAPAFGAKAASLDLRPAFELPEGVTTGEALNIFAMPDVAKLNTIATANAPKNTELYAWLVDSGMAKEIIELADFEDILRSVYDEEPEWEMTLTPLYKAV